MAALDATAASTTPADTPEGCLRPTLHALDDSEAWRAALLEDGFVVIHPFLPEEDREAILGQFWVDLKEAAKRGPDHGRFGRFNRHNRDSWPSMANKKRGEIHAQIHIPQSDFSWQLRTHPHVAQTFARVHEVAPDELCCSLDSFSLHCTGHPPKGLKLHDDQVANLDERSEIFSVQGSYNFFSVEDDDTGFLVVPGSHQRWAKRRSGNPKVKHKRHFSQLQSGEKQYDTAYETARKLLIPANSFVLWNSKTLHGTATGTRERPDEAGPVPNRLTCFIAMLPKALRSGEVLLRKRRLYEHGGTTSHWANDAAAHVVNQSATPGRMVPACDVAEAHAGADGGAADEGAMVIPPARLALL